MILPHLHLGAWNTPFGRIKVDLGPLGGAQFSRANENQRQLERGNGVSMAIVGVDGAQQFCGLLRLGDRGVARFRDSGERASQIRGNVAVGKAASDREPKYLAAQLFDLMR